MRDQGAAALLEDPTSFSVGGKDAGASSGAWLGSGTDT